MAPVTLWLSASFIAAAQAALFADLLKGISRAHSVSNLFNSIPDSFRDELENDEGTAAVFICDILNGDVEDAIAEIPSAVISEASADLATVTSFIEAIPSIAEDTLSYLVQDGEDVVSVVGELFTNPAAAITVIESDVTSVFEGFASEVTSAWSDVTCFFAGDCSHTDTDGALYTIGSSCSQVLASADAGSVTTQGSTAYTYTTQNSLQPYPNPTPGSPTYTYGAPPTATVAGGTSLQPYPGGASVPYTPTYSPTPTRASGGSGASYTGSPGSNAARHGVSPASWLGCFSAMGALGVLILALL